MQSVLQNVWNWIKTEENKEQLYKTFVGFDGCVDTIAKPVKQITESGMVSYFESIEEFAGFLKSKAGKSCSVELQNVTKKVGGNAAIFAKAISKLGIYTECVGAFGYPVPLELFQPDNQNLEVVSISEPARCTALEFTDGKIMLSENGAITNLNYDYLVKSTGEDNLYRKLNEATVIALMNWSEIPGIMGIWRGLSENILPRLTTGKQRYFFIDISDCSRRCSEDILCMLQILSEFSGYGQVILSLNQNEFEILCAAAKIQNKEQISEAGKYLCRTYHIRHLILHLRDGAYACTEENVCYVKTRYIHMPAISTGGGDNFNAGLIYGMVCGMPVEWAMTLGNASSGFYISNGYSATLEQLARYLELWIKEEEVGSLT